MISPRTPCATSDVRQQFAKHAVGGVGRARHHQHVTRLADFNRRVNHDVVAGLATDRDSRPRDLGGRINRAQIRLHQAGAALRFVHCGDAQFAQYLDGFRIRARDATNDLMFHEILRYERGGIGDRHAPYFRRMEARVEHFLREHGEAFRHRRIDGLPQVRG